MKYRRFGRTEINMPLISMGGMRFQTSWKREDKVRPDSIANLDRTVAHALDLGIHHFETAHGYGTSEEELGQVQGVCHGPVEIGNGVRFDLVLAFPGGLKAHSAHGNQGYVDLCFSKTSVLHLSSPYVPNWG